MSKPRSCGQCRACCTTCLVEGLAPPKPAQTPCVYLNAPPAKGCGQYETRPTECRTFQCAWLAKWDPLVQFGQFLDRPDRFGVVLDVQRPEFNGGHITYVASLAPGHTVLPLRVREYLRILASHEVVMFVEGSGDQEWSGPDHLLARVATPQGTRLKLRVF